MSPRIVPSSTSRNGSDEASNLLEHHTAKSQFKLIISTPPFDLLTSARAYLLNLIFISQTHTCTTACPNLSALVRIHPRCGSVVLTLDSQSRVILRDLLAILADKPNFTQLQRESVGEKPEKLRELGYSERSESREVESVRLNRYLERETCLLVGLHRKNVL